MSLSDLSRQELVELAKAIQEAETRGIEWKQQADNYRAFQQRYYDDLAGFAVDCVDWPPGMAPAAYQLDACRGLVRSRRFSMRGPHGLGKTAIASIVILWFALTRDGTDWKVPTLASAWRQLQKFLWPEVHKWARLLRWDVIGRQPFENGKELMALSLKLQTGEAFAIASDNPAYIEGAHADNMLYLFDESKTIPDETWDAAEGAMSSGNSFWFAISTPGEPNGRFYDIHSRKRGYSDWEAYHVTLSAAVAAGRISQAWANARALQWGESSAVYQNRVLGNFAASDTDSVISLAMIERAVARWHEINDAGAWGPLWGIGADIGRGVNPSVIAFRHGDAIKDLETNHDKTIMPVTGRLAAILRQGTLIKAVIDVVGIGAGVVDRLREQPDIARRVYAFVSGKKCDMTDESGELGFVDLRSAGWWQLREMLMKDIGALPPVDELIGELSAPKYKYMSGGKIRVEPKEEVEKRLKRSTDHADAVMMIYMAAYADAAAGLEGLGSVEDYVSMWR